MNYKFGNKNNWRRWAWNRISERTENPREACVLYLPGPQNNDEDIALAAGFRAANLIGVERDKKCATTLRESGTPTAIGDIFDVGVTWPTTRPIGVFFADLFRGISPELVISLVQMMALPQFSTCVFAFNLKRGRDKGVAAVKDQLMRYKTVGENEKHRGLLLYYSMHILFMEMVINAIGCDPHHAANEVKRAHQFADPRTTTYRSNKSIFDSIVFVNPVGVSRHTHTPGGIAEWEDVARTLQKEVCSERPKAEAARRSAIATRAVLTSKHRARP